MYMDIYVIFFNFFFLLKFYIIFQISQIFLFYFIFLYITSIRNKRVEYIQFYIY